MDRKHKLGKDRLDKYYHLAKEQGYRSRSAFKILQLSKKFNFFEDCRVLVDLCAAPGGWLQVAVRQMPVSSIILGVDLVPIRPIKGVVTLQGDIRTQKCHHMIMNNLNGSHADVVLHDGAPNMGCNWNLDAFNQNLLVLDAAKLAANILRKGGTFVTKIFRSADYNSLIWMMSQCFDRVKVTKPQSSRNVSAEVFAICIGFKSLKGLDHRLFNCDYVFQSRATATAKEESDMVKSTSLNQLLKLQKKKNKEGYDAGDDFRETSVLEFFNSSNPASILLFNNRLNFEPKDDAVLQKILDNPKTIQEIKLLCSDLKVAGKGDLMSLLRWRFKIRKEMSDVFTSKEEKPIQDTNVSNVDELDDVETLENFVKQRVEAQERRLQRKQRKLLKKHRKSKCDTAVSVAHDPELFNIQELDLSDVDNEVGSEGVLDSDASDTDAEEIELESSDWDCDIELDDDVKHTIKMDVDLQVQDALKAMEKADRPKAKMTRRQRVQMERGAEVNNLLQNLQYEARLNAAAKAKEEDEEDEDDNDAVGGVDEEGDGNVSDDHELVKDPAFKNNAQMDRWFDQDIFKHVEAVGNDDKSRTVKANGDVKRAAAATSKQDDPASVDELEPFKVVAAISNAELESMAKEVSFEDLKNTKDGIESVQTIGSLLIHKKTRMALIDGSFNRRTFDDVDELPSWFVEDEKRHSNYELPVTKELMKKYKKKLLEIKQRPIRKVQEAQARKKRRMQHKLKSVLPRMEALANEDGNASAIKRLARKISTAGSNKRDKVYVVSRKSGTVKTSGGASKSKGSRKKVKPVDSRMKKDTRAQQRAQHGRRRRSKSKKAKLH